jgi:hypothetical protein
MVRLVPDGIRRHELGGVDPVVAQGIVPTITFVGGAPISVNTSDCDAGTDANGNCDVVINSNVVGTFTVHAAADINVLGLTLHLETNGQDGNSGDATKTYVPPPFQGQIAPTATTCQDFVNGTASDLDEVLYGVKAGNINNTAPGVFFYYTRVTAPDPSFTVDVTQTETHTSFSTLFGVQNEDQIRLFNADCTNSSLGAISNGGGQAHIAISGATTGQVFIVSVKYQTSTVVGITVPDPTTVHYDFKTFIGLTQVDQDPNGLDLTLKTK